MDASLRRLCLALCAGGALASGSVLADPFPMGTGHAPQPLRDSTVAIAQEDLALTIGRSDVQVSARLDLHNQGAAPVALDVGFPCVSGSDERVIGLDCSVRPSVSWKGKPVVPKLRRGPRREGTWVWPMRFAASEHTELVVRYTTRLTNPRYKIPLAGAAAIYYRLTTGAKWAGAIGRLDIEVTTPVETITYIAPKGYTRTPGKIRWSLRDHEPAEDVVIGLAPPETSRYLAIDPSPSPSADTRANTTGAAASTAEQTEELRRFATSFRASAKRIAQSYARFFSLPAIGAEHALPMPSQAELDRCTTESAQILEQLAGLPEPASAKPPANAPAPAHAPAAAPAR